MSREDEEVGVGELVGFIKAVIIVGGSSVL
jgi:hypothetical protein